MEAKTFVTAAAGAERGEGNACDRKLRTLNDASQMCEDYARKCGLRYVFFWFRVPLLQAQPAQFVITNYPREWMERYRDQSYIKIDPAVQRMMSAIGPFTLPADESEAPGAGEFLSDARKHGLDGGFCVPLHGPNGAHAAMTLAGGTVPPQGSEQDKLFADSLLFGLRVFDGVLKIVANHSKARRAGDLSERQRDVLTAIAEGRTVDEIMELFELGRGRVKDLLTQSVAKMGVTTREQAIVRALASGLIHPAAFPSTFKITSLATRPDSLFVQDDQL